MLVAMIGKMGPIGMIEEEVGLRWDVSQWLQYGAKALVTDLDRTARKSMSGPRTRSSGVLIYEDFVFLCQPWHDT